MSLSQNAEPWLKNGQRCRATDTIFTLCTGVDVLSGEPDVPRTLEDLRRCRLLLDAVPELRSCLPRVAQLVAWVEVISFWDDLCLMQDFEDPDWRIKTSRATETKAMLNRLIGVADE